MLARFRTPLLVIMAALALSGLTSPLATAATPPVSSVFGSDDLELGYTKQVSEYGGAFGIPRFALPVSATRIRVEFRFDEYDLTFCALSTLDGTTVAQASWGNNEDVIDVPVGATQVGVEYDLSCETGYYGESATTWHLVGTTGTATSVLYEERTQQKLVRVVESRNAFLPGPVGRAELARGERFRVAPYPRFWTVPGTAELTGTIATDADAPQSSLEQVTLGSGAAYVDATVPATLSSAYDLPWIRITRTGTIPGGVGTFEKVTIRQVFFGPRLVTKAATTTTLKLDASTVVRYQPKATIKVTAADGSAPVGEVVLVVDGRAEVAEVRLDGTEGGAAVLRVPRLSRGSHSVVAVFRDGTGQLGSVSAARPLRQLV